MIDLTDLAPAFAFVLARGLVPSGGKYKAQEFGNASMVMIGKQFSLRFERDRGQVFVDIGSSAAGWYKLEYILEFVDNAVTQEQLGEPPDAAVLANLLQLHWEAVAKLFSDQQQVLQLQAFASQKSANMLRRLFPKL